MRDHRSRLGPRGPRGPREFRGPPGFGPEPPGLRPRQPPGFAPAQPPGFRAPPPPRLPGTPTAGFRVRPVRCTSPGFPAPQPPGFRSPPPVGFVAAPAAGFPISPASRLPSTAGRSASRRSSRRISDLPNLLAFDLRRRPGPRQPPGLRSPQPPASALRRRSASRRSSRRASDLPDFLVSILAAFADLRTPAISADRLVSPSRRVSDLPNLPVSERRRRPASRLPSLPASDRRRSASSCPNPRASRSPELPGFDAPPPSGLLAPQPPGFRPRPASGFPIRTSGLRGHRRSIASGLPGFPASRLRRSLSLEPRALLIPRQLGTARADPHDRRPAARSRATTSRSGWP